MSPPPRLWLPARSCPIRPRVAGVPVDFILFALTLLGVALFHHHTLRVALVGLASITLYKLAVLAVHRGRRRRAASSRTSRTSGCCSRTCSACCWASRCCRKHSRRAACPAWLPRFLPDDWKGGFVLLVMIFVLSSFLDNIAAALIGGTIAGVVFRGKVHIGYLAAIVAASNAGGSGSVVGDTTTTMMWIDGVSPLSVLEAYIAAAVAMVIFGIPAALQQQRYSPIVKDAPADVRVDWVRVVIVASSWSRRSSSTSSVNVRFNDTRRTAFPFIGAAVWVAILACAPLRRPHWEVLPGAFKGSIFLLSLVLAASMMPVEKLPDASWQVALGLGFVSAVFDNIPLTALALKQGGYDWGFLAYAVGFGGSMIWFGSSAGVALSNQFPEAQVGRRVAARRLARRRRLRHRIFRACSPCMGWHPHRSTGARAPDAARRRGRRRAVANADSARGSTRFRRAVDRAAITERR